LRDARTPVAVHVASEDDGRLGTDSKDGGVGLEQFLAMWELPVARRRVAEESAIPGVPERTVCHRIHGPHDNRLPARIAGLPEQRECEVQRRRMGEFWFDPEAAVSLVE